MTEIFYGKSDLGISLSMIHNPEMNEKLTGKQELSNFLEKNVSNGYLEFYYKNRLDNHPFNLIHVDIFYDSRRVIEKIKTDTVTEALDDPDCIR